MRQCSLNRLLAASHLILVRVLRTGTTSDSATNFNVYSLVVAVCVGLTFTC